MLRGSVTSRKCLLKNAVEFESHRLSLSYTRFAIHRLDRHCSHLLDGVCKKANMACAVRAIIAELGAVPTAIFLQSAFKH